MSERGIKFARHWVFENINVELYDPGDVIIGNAVAELTEAAAKEGISVEEIEEDCGELSDFVAEAFQERTDAEVHRRASEDD